MPAGKVFVDTTILVYAQDKAAPTKQRRARDVIAKLAAAGNGVISTQVIQEFYVASTGKLGVERGRVHPEPVVVLGRPDHRRCGLP